MTAAPDPSRRAPAAPVRPERLAVVKGHGTENDFVLVDDRAGALDLLPADVRFLTDRRAGLGADGVIRLAPSADLPEGRACLAEDAAAVWFMDYRNADGTAAEMCGNGVRVTALFAERLGAWDGAGELVLGTRAGVRRVRRVLDPTAPAADAVGPPWYAVEMGAWRLVGGGTDTAGDAEVHVHGLPVARPGLSVDVGNPHTVVALADVRELEAADLAAAPQVSPAPPHGTNVELVVPLGEHSGPDGLVGEVRMRVHERGVGETRSCGTGACAAAMAVRTWAGAGAPDAWWVHVPGGTVQVTALPGGRVELAGPAVLVADAVLALPTPS
ncbi:diaminopimelate epimerase [Actinotalea sp. Marseille-Q4924]|uniref:diaminopimelate epimerase n=1 Tax=Actinotalea sp. Marseille-Q4924 TaxID=2866571 RepID=UPI001CE4531A|nr:diaminopimelate epimerase [Actinotalea sp. Marseille-Q4924]